MTAAEQGGEPGAIENAAAVAIASERSRSAMRRREPTVPHVKPAALGQIARRELALGERLRRVLDGWSVAVGVAHGGSRPAPVGTAFERPVRVVLGDHERRAILTLDDGACRRLLEPLTTRETFDALDENLATAALACVLDEWLTAFERESGAPVEVRSLERTDEAPVGTLDAEVRGCRLVASSGPPGDGQGRVGLSCDDAAAVVIERLLDAMPAAPVRSGLDDVPVPLRCRLGTSELPFGELASLEPGDAVLIERCRYARDGTFDVLLGRCHRARGELRDRRVRLITSGDTFLEHIEQGEGPSERGGERSGETPDDITVRIEFDLGGCEMPIAAVRRLGEGSVVDLGDSLDGAVTVRCNGRTVGYGELVEIDGERYGVRLTALAD